MTNNDYWMRVEDGLPLRSGRYQVILLNGDSYHVTMRKFYADKKHWLTGKPGVWERGTSGITHWKPMDELPLGLKPDEHVLDYGGKW